MLDHERPSLKWNPYKCLNKEVGGEGFHYVICGSNESKTPHAPPAHQNRLNQKFPSK